MRVGAAALWLTIQVFDRLQMAACQPPYPTSSTKTYIERYGKPVAF
jgi:hypothetical protein